MASAKGGTVQIPWYATGFRGDALETALIDISKRALRYGASDWSVLRTRDDRYKFFQSFTFEDPSDFERFWYSDEFSTWRARHSGHFQVPVVYYWCDRVGGSVSEAAAAVAGE